MRELDRASNQCIDGNLGRYDEREKCDRCDRRNPIGFVVPDPVWNRINEIATKEAAAWNNQPNPLPQGPFDILCIICFIEIADWNGVEWSESIELHPCSRYSITALNLWLEAGGVSV